MKKYYQLNILLLILIGLYTTCSFTDDFIGAETPKYKKIIGGAKEYTKIIDKAEATFLVRNKYDFLRALKIAKQRDIIYITDDASIDLSDESNLRINSGVTLASGRSKIAKGALIYSSNLATSPLFLTNGEKVRITGIRLQGPDSLRRTEQMKALAKKSKKDYYSIPNSRGIQIVHSNIEIDNCEIYGWSHAAIFAKGDIRNIYIHNNNIHHNQRQGLGYGITLDGAEVLIEANFFDWNRHSIAGTGQEGTSYEARYNIIGIHGSSHAFDMHGGKDRNDGSDVAGSLIKIHHNTFLLEDKEAIMIRGIPQKSVEIYNNHFPNLDSLKAIKQVNAKGKMKAYNNQFLKKQ